LRAGLLGQLAVSVGGADAEVVRHGFQVANRGQKRAVSGHVLDRARVGGVPLVQLGLQAVTLGQQGAVLRRQVVHQLAKAGPECTCFQAGAR